MFGKTHFKWTEPALFVPRERTRNEWMVRVVLALLAASLIAAVTFFAAGANWTRVITAGFLTFGVLLLIFDACYIMRDIWIDDTKINCHGNAGQIQTFLEVPLAKIQSATIERSSEIGRSYHRLMLLLTDNTFCKIGIPTRLSLENLAQKLFELNVPTELSGWTARPAGSRPITNSLFGGNLADASVGVRKATALAVVTPVQSDEKKLVEVTHQIVGALAAGWPALITLGALIASIAWAIWYRAQNPWWLNTIAIVGALILVYLSLQLVAWWAGPIETTYVIGVARSRLGERPNALIKGNDPRIVTLSRYTEEACKKQLGMSIDDGFLIADSSTRTIYFEGNKNRCQIPFDSIIEAQVEEFSIGAESESGVIMKKWFVHLAFQTADGREDYYLRLSHERFGAETKAAQRRAEDLLLYLDGHVHA